MSSGASTPTKLSLAAGQLIGESLSSRALTLDSETLLGLSAKRPGLECRCCGFAVERESIVLDSRQQNVPQVQLLSTITRVVVCFVVGHEAFSSR